jgi:hypothetical protein
MDPNAPTEIQEAAQEIEAVLKKHNLGMHAVLQIFKLTPQAQDKNPIIMAGNENGKIMTPGDTDIPPGILDAMTAPAGEIRK